LGIFVNEIIAWKWC